MGRWTFEIAVAFCSDLISLIFEKEAKLDVLLVVFKVFMTHDKLKFINNRRREMPRQDDFQHFFYYFYYSSCLSGQFSLKFSRLVPKCPY